MVDVGTWESDNSIHDFPKSLEEFERRVTLQNERLAIGFTSQYTLLRGNTHLGGIRGPLASHLLVREWSQVITEPERLEVLLHEIGHFFGAAHSPEPTSVMRPAAGRPAGCQVPHRTGPAQHAHRGLDWRSIANRCRSAQPLTARPEHAVAAAPIYAQLALAMPDDPNPRRYVGLIDDGSVERTARAGRAIVTAIEANAARIAATRPQENAPGPTPAEIVASPEWRLWAAAKLALDLPPDLQATSCLLAVSLTGSERELVAGHPLARPVCQRVIERPADEQPAAAGNATAEHDEQHRLDRLLAWAALASLVGGAEAEAAALVATGIANSQATSVDSRPTRTAAPGFAWPRDWGPAGRSSRSPGSPKKKARRVCCRSWAAS